MRTAAYVDGKWITEGGAGEFAVHNPANGDLVATLPSLDRAQAAEAIDAADRAQRSWRTQSAKQRATTLRKWFDLIVGNAGDLAEIITREQGKPQSEAKAEIA